MPFPLAHPAGVLPLRRCCPRFFDFPALVIGSLMPDVGYLFITLNLHEFSHRFLGSILFCLPLGLVFYVLLYWLRSLVIWKYHPKKLSDLLQVAWPSRGSAIVLAGSILAGTWTHEFLDSFTHKDGWLTRRSTLLQFRVGSFAGHDVKVYGLLWFFCSFVGIALVVLAFQNWRRNLSHAPIANSPAANWRSALLVASAVLPIELVHRLFNNLVGTILVSLMTLLLLAIVVRRFWAAEVTMAR